MIDMKDFSVNLLSNVKYFPDSGRFHFADQSAIEFIEGRCDLLHSIFLYIFMSSENIKR